jgi:hypothetical protein
VKGWIDDEDSIVFKTTEGIEPLTFVLGEGEVIEGWEKGLMGMWCSTNGPQGSYLHETSLMPMHAHQ